MARVHGAEMKRRSSHELSGLEGTVKTVKTPPALECTKRVASVLTPWMTASTRGRSLVLAGEERQAYLLRVPQN